MVETRGIIYFNQLIYYYIKWNKIYTENSLMEYISRLHTAGINYIRIHSRSLSPHSNLVLQGFHELPK